MTILRDASSRICEVATDVACRPGAASWNARFVAAIEAQGWELVPISRDGQLGDDGPIWAPIPAPDGEAYPYPCVVAPRGWTHPTTSAARHVSRLLAEALVAKKRKRRS